MSLPSLIIRPQKHFVHTSPIGLVVIFLLLCTHSAWADNWPDGTPIDAWFADTTKVNVDQLGKKYIVTDYGVSTNPTIVQTAALQAVIDRCHKEGGGVVVIPAGTFMSGALFFKGDTHLSEGATLKGSDRIADYPVLETRFEGETCKYFSAFINADHADGFTITGSGTIDGNGYRYWQEFWIRRKWNPQCTNKDAQATTGVYQQFEKRDRAGRSSDEQPRVDQPYLQLRPCALSQLFHLCTHVRRKGSQQRCD